MSHRRSSKSFIATLLAVVGATLALPATSYAAFAFGQASSDLNQAGAFSDPPIPNGQAGAHPDLALRFSFLSDQSPYAAEESPAKIQVNLPPGMLGDPTAVPTCSERQFDVARDCSASSQVGRIDLRLNDGGINDPFAVIPTGGIPVYNLERLNPNQTARLGFHLPLANYKINITIQPRSESDYGLEATIDGIPRFYQFTTGDLQLWGVPGAAAHDPDRYDFNGYQEGEQPRPNPQTGGRPFLTSPTRCAAPLATTFSSRSYETSAIATRQASLTSGLSGCDQIPFRPAISFSPTGPAPPDSPGGFEASVTVPQNNDGNSVATSHLRRAAITLPSGVSINPSTADGLVACTDEQLRLGTRDAPACPDAAKLGSSEVDVPILGATLKGSLYVRPQTSEEPYRVMLTASGSGVNAKIPGVVRPDPATGQLTAIFDQAPQVPFSQLRVRFDAGPRAVLATGIACGAAQATAGLDPWSGTGERFVTATSFQVTSPSGCASEPPFSPSVSAGSLSSASGRTSPFSLRLQRDDGNQELNGLSATLPRGLTAIVKDVPLCDLGAAASGTCGRQSQIGTITAGAGAGPAPFFVSGKAYLTRGYKGGAYGVSFVIPAVAGPFDLGNVVVQAAVRVDPVTAQLTVESDAFPRILRGVPLRIRDVRVNIDRPRFTLNPTNCSQLSTQSRVYAVQGASILRQSPFQATNCGRQSFKPAVALTLTGKRELTDGRHPGLKAAVKLKQGSANIARVRATLPESLALDPGNAQALCKYEDGQRVRCPRSSIIGRAKITTPLLNRPLSGPVYFVENQRRNKQGRIVKTLPTLLLTLRGEVALNLRATTSVASGKNLVTTFSGVPDQPFSRFDLAIDGGSHGILAANTSVCRKSRDAGLRIDGQNGKRYDPTITVKAPCR